MTDLCSISLTTFGFYYFLSLFFSTLYFVNYECFLVIILTTDVSLQKEKWKFLQSHKRYQRDTLVNCNLVEVLRFSFFVGWISRYEFLLKEKNFFHFIPIKVCLYLTFLSRGHLCVVLFIISLKKPTFLLIKSNFLR